MDESLSVLIPYEQGTAAAAATFAHALSGEGAQVVLAGHGAPPVDGVEGVEVIPDLAGKGAAIREGLARVRGAITLIQDPDPAYPTSAYPDLLAPIRAGTADAVFGSRSGAHAPLADRALSRFAHLVTDTPLADPLTGVRAFRTEALRGLRLASAGEEIDAEIVVKMAAQAFRLVDVPVPLSAPARRSLAGLWERARTLLRYATTHNDADNVHEGYNTLLRMEAAPNYNAWLGRRIREHLGRRVLEVGAGIGTITREIEAGRELVIALEVDSFYVDRLKNLFRGKPHVRPYLSDVALADWEALRAERIDSILISNVLEHVADDAGAVRRFRQVLQPGGRVVVLAPALPALYGSMDEAVGHFRRYTPASLRAVLEDNGFVVEALSWMSLVGIPGWFVNGRLLRRRSVPPLQLRLYDQVAPLLAHLEDHVRLPIGMSLFAVARTAGEDR